MLIAVMGGCRFKAECGGSQLERGAARKDCRERLALCRAGAEPCRRPTRADGSAKRSGLPLVLGVYWRVLAWRTPSSSWACRKAVER